DRGTQVLAGHHRVRADRGRAGRGGPGDHRGAAGAGVGAAGVRDELHPQRRVRDRPDPGRAAGLARGRAELHDLGDRGLQFPELHHSGAPAAEGRRRGGRAQLGGLLPVPDVWTIVVGPLGTILAIPLTLAAKTFLVDAHPEARWINAFLVTDTDARKLHLARAATD